MSGLPSVTAPGERHCATCTCPGAGVSLTAYPPNAVLYGTCGQCGQPFWEVTVWDYRRAGRAADYAPEKFRHCGCCAGVHEHRPPGGYELPHRPRVIG